MSFVGFSFNMERIKVENEEDHDIKSLIKVEKVEIQEDDSQSKQETISPKQEQDSEDNTSGMVYFNITTIKEEKFEEDDETSNHWRYGYGSPSINATDLAVKKEEVDDKVEASTVISRDPDPESSQSKCIYCDKIFIKSPNLLKHLSIKHRGFPTEYLGGFIECSICKEVFKSIKSLKNHVKENHPCPKEPQRRRSNHLKPRDLFHCFHCGIKKTTLGELRKHMSAHITERSISCNLCLKTYKDRHGLSAHMRYIHSTNEYVQCPECSKTMLKTRLRRHQLMSHSFKTINCLNCSRKFKYISEMKIHMKRVHSAQFECYICQAKFKHSKACEMHLKVHEFHREQQEQNETSTINIKDQKTVNSEKSKKSPVKPDDYEKRRYECDVCKRRFTTRAILVRHGVTHTDSEANFKCQKCPRAFKAKFQLKQHIGYYHSGECSCTICGKVFPGKDSLCAHMKHHQRTISPLLLQCDLCQKTFNLRSTLYQHLIRIHKLGKDVAKDLVEEVTAESKEKATSLNVSSVKAEISNKDSENTQHALTTVIVKEEYEAN